MSNGRFNAEQKRLINSPVDVNQIMPLRYEWAWEHYLNGNRNHWNPEEISMGDDVKLWKSSQLSEDERLVLMRNLGFFATAESLVANNLCLAIYKMVSAPECRQYILRQAVEEAIHTHTFMYCCESLGLDQGEIFNMYNEIPSVAAKKEFEVPLTRDILEGNLDLSQPQDIQRFLRNLIGFYVILEGIMFYSGFVMILNFGQRNYFPGIRQQFRYIMRDESIHMNFGVDLINGIKAENPDVWTYEFKQQIYGDIQQGVQLEIAYAKECLPRGILGLNAGMFEDYVGYIADRRLERIGLNKIYGTKNPFPWMSEQIDMKKKENFFETQVTEYAQASTLEDDL
jgi:ribonucleoside-diphosphate reductase beta chain